MNQFAVAPQDRPIWRKIVDFPLVAMVIALVLVVAALFATSRVLDMLPETMAPAAQFVIRGFAAVLAGLLVYKLVVRHLGRQPHDDLPLAGALSDTGLGLGVGAMLFSTVVGVAAVVGAYRILGMGGWSDFVEIVMATGVVAGFTEELILRGIIFRWLEELAGSAIALALSSLLFGFLHAMNPNATLFSSIAIALEAGILLGGAYMLTRSLWLAIGIHAGWNITQGFIWGVPVSGFEFEGLVQGQLYGPAWKSGGAFGLEASVIALVIAGGAGLWLVWQARKEGRWVAPMWSRREG